MEIEEKVIETPVIGIDLTDVFRSQIENKEVANAAVIFNNSIIHVIDNRFIMACRYHIPTSWKILNNSDLPVMWRAIGSVKDGWNSLESYVMILYVEFKNGMGNLPFVMKSERIENYPNAINEDPRLCKHADGSFWIYYIVSQLPCRIKLNNKGDIGERCQFMVQQSLPNPLIKKQYIVTRNIICAFDYIKDLPFDSNNRFFQKNWSHWTYDNKEFWTDFYPVPKIYTADNVDVGGTGKCIEETGQHVGNFSQIKNLKKWFTINFNKTINPRDHKEYQTTAVNLFHFSSTTPSIQVSEEIRSRYFSNYKVVYAGVAHIRTGCKNVFTNDEIFEAIGDSFKNEMAFYGSFWKFYSELKNIYDKGFLYLHADIYSMCIYFFDPSVDANGNRGNIIATSNIFNPLFTNQKTKRISSRFCLSFPTGLMINRETIFISYGEGDCKCRLISIPFTELTMHKFDDDYGKNLQWNVMYVTGKNGNYDETRSVNQMIKDMIKQ